MNRRNGSRLDKCYLLLCKSFSRRILRIELSFNRFVLIVIEFLCNSEIFFNWLKVWIYFIKLNPLPLLLLLRPSFVLRVDSIFHHKSGSTSTRVCDNLTSRSIKLFCYIFDIRDDSKVRSLVELSLSMLFFAFIFLLLANASRTNVEGHPFCMEWTGVEWMSSFFSFFFFPVAL